MYLVKQMIDTDTHTSVVLEEVSSMRSALDALKLHREHDPDEHFFLGLVQSMEDPDCYNNTHSLQEGI